MKFSRLSTLAVTAITLVALVYAGCKSEQKIALKFAPKKGKKYEITMNTVQDIEMEQQGQKMNMKNTMDFTYTMDVQEKDKNNNIVINTVFKRIRFGSTTPMGEMNYDSDSKTNDTANFYSVMFTKAFGSMVNKQVVVVVDESGKVVSLKGMEAIFDDMLKSMGLDTVEGGEQMVAGFKTQFSDDKFKQTFDEMFRILPAKEVNVGEGWDIEYDKELMNMKMKMKNKYLLKDIKDDDALVGVTSDFTMQQGEGETPGGNMNMTGTQTGTMKIDMETGLAIEGDLQQDITATAMGMPTKIKSTIKINSKEIK